MIEKNTVSPSFSSLLKVLKGFPMGVEEFFTTDLVMSNQVVFRAHEQADMSAQGVAIKLIGHSVAERNVSMLSETYPPGSDTGEEMIKYEGEEAGIVVEGEIELTVDHQTYQLATGDGYFFRTHLPHRFRNLGEITAKVVSANTGTLAH
jgi:quercetin dioxygenase-like cupin family protein